MCDFEIRYPVFTFSNVRFNETISGLLSGLPPVAALATESQSSLFARGFSGYFGNCSSSFSNARSERWGM